MGHRAHVTFNFGVVDKHCRGVGFGQCFLFLNASYPEVLELFPSSRGAGTAGVPVWRELHLCLLPRGDRCVDSREERSS